MRSSAVSRVPDQPPGRAVLFADFTSPESRAVENALTSLAGEHGLQVNFAPWEQFPPGTPLLKPGTPRTRKAHEAARFARLHGVEPEMRAALYGAYLDDGRDIGRIDVLVEIGETQGLDRTELKVTLDIDQFTDDVLRDQAAGRRLGVTQAPTLVIVGGSEARILTGVHSPAELARILHV